MQHYTDQSLHLWNTLREELMRWTSYYDRPRHRAPARHVTEREKIREKLYEVIDRRRSDLEDMDLSTGSSPSVPEYSLVVLSVVAAILNPFHTEWDVTRYAERVKNSRVNADGHLSEADSNLGKYFARAEFGDIDEPATILDCHGRVIAWHLPGLLSRKRIEEYNNAVLGLDKILAGSMQKYANTSSWRGMGFMTTGPESVFHPGTADFSPGWFMQRQQCLQDGLYPSTDLRTEEGSSFLCAISNVEQLMDAVLCLTANDLYLCAAEAICEVKRGEVLKTTHSNIDLWPSVFSGLQVIVNRRTPRHCDSGAAPSAYDLLLSIGTHTSARIGLLDINTTFSYSPGTIVLLCGRVMLHEVPDWDGGERICIAHYIRDAVHNRLRLEQPDWVTYGSYSSLMSQGFRSRQGL